MTLPTIEHHVVSLKLAKKLKKNGYPQEGEFWWCKFTDDSYKDVVGSCKPDDEWFLLRNDGSLYYKEKYFSPLASELMERFPDWKDNKSIYVFNYCGTYFVQLRKWRYGEIIKDCRGDNLCEALASMWLYLKKEYLL